MAWIVGVDFILEATRCYKFEIISSIETPLIKDCYRIEQK